MVGRRKKRVAKEDRPQFNVRLPDDVMDYLFWVERRKGASKAKYVLAALVAYEHLPERARGYMMEIATRLAKGKTEWEAVPGVARRWDKEFPTREEIIAGLDELLAAERASPQGRRRVENR